MQPDPTDEEQVAIQAADRLKQKLQQSRDRKREHEDDREYEALVHENDALKQDLHIMRCAYEELQTSFGQKCGEVIRLRKEVEELRRARQQHQLSAPPSSAAAAAAGGMSPAMRQLQLQSGESAMTPTPTVASTGATLASAPAISALALPPSVPAVARSRQGAVAAAAQSATPQQGGAPRSSGGGGSGASKYYFEPWTCALCDVTVSSEATLMAHLHSRRHKRRAQQQQGQQQHQQGQSSPLTHRDGGGANDDAASAQDLQSESSMAPLRSDSQSQVDVVNNAAAAQHYHHYASQQQQQQQQQRPPLQPHGGYASVGHAGAYNSYDAGYGGGGAGGGGYGHQQQVQYHRQSGPASYHYQPYSTPGARSDGGFSTNNFGDGATAAPTVDDFGNQLAAFRSTLSTFMNQRPPQLPYFQQPYLPPPSYGLAYAAPPPPPPPPVTVGARPSMSRGALAYAPLPPGNVVVEAGDAMHEQHDEQD